MPDLPDLIPRLDALHEQSRRATAPLLPSFARAMFEHWPDLREMLREKDEARDRVEKVAREWWLGMGHAHEERDAALKRVADLEKELDETRRVRDQRWAMAKEANKRAADLERALTWEYADPIVLDDFQRNHIHPTMSVGEIVVARSLARDSVRWFVEEATRRCAALAAGGGADEA